MHLFERKILLSIFSIWRKIIKPRTSAVRVTIQTGERTTKQRLPSQPLKRHAAKAKLWELIRTKCQNELGDGCVETEITEEFREKIDEIIKAICKEAL